MACVLIADDDPIVRELLSAWLYMSGYDCVEAADGVEALELIRSGPVDLVICDLMMPRLDGAGLVEALRAQPATRGLPILILTVRSRADDAAALLDAGADDYVRKPIDWAELRARIERQLRRMAA